MMNSNGTARRNRLIGLALGTVLASGALAGCTGGRAPDAQVSAGKAGEALEKGRISAAVRHAEAAVLAEPRVAQHRVTLGATYLQAGRFRSAETSFAEAMELGEESSRVVVSRALAMVAMGRPDDGHSLLDEYHDRIDPSDLGLAFALAGDAERGAWILAAELRDRQNTPKVRQNLAYALALKGDWRSARMLVAEDVPADRIGERLGQWAATASPQAQTLRVANLLGVTVAGEDARPAELALANFPSVPMLAAEATASQPVDVTPTIAIAVAEPSGELPPVHAAAAAAASRMEAVAPQRFDSAPLNPAPTAPARVATVAPPERAAPAPSPATHTARPTATAPAQRLQSGNHLVQLGSYLTEADARRAWDILQSRFALLKDAAFVITRAEVKGRIYYRVAAGNLAEASARSLCSTVMARGQGCFAYSGDRTLPGTIERKVRVAGR